MEYCQIISSLRSFKPTFLWLMNSTPWHVVSILIHNLFLNSDYNGTRNKVLLLISDKV